MVNLDYYYECQWVERERQTERQTEREREREANSKLAL